MKILIIEDDDLTRKIIIKMLKEEGYEVLDTPNGSEGLVLINRHNPNLILLDLMLPDINGIYICEQVRNHPEKYGNPFILMLTSKVEEEDVVLGLDSGADDYIKKPFGKSELLSRVKAVLRRNSLINSTIYKYKNIVLQKSENRIIVDNKDLDLTKKEFELLLYFIINKGIVLSRDTIMKELWDMYYYPRNKTLDVYIGKLKKKIESFNLNLEVVRGVGYKLKN